ncbi:4-alpha-glucanotransferase [uncultured Roseobacter sp.]|uniref:4-alpha-glucanotransferase n=1 Tax=uncultured Roseobacter sp. TaxID=114847 RepID=UPI00262CCB1D|nr:4-alpha-glucanotransferase [uncultured Roseobacter sp.]
MNADQALRALADEAGIFPEFKDLEGVIRPTGVDTQRALLRAAGFAAGSGAEIAESLDALAAEKAAALLPPDVFATTGAAAELLTRADCSWHVIADGSSEEMASGITSECRLSLPALPSGVHHLHLERRGEAQEVRLLVSPGKTPSLEQTGAGAKTWGVVAALYGLHSESNTGPGSFEELQRLAAVLGLHGAGFLGINPVHALGWADKDTISPYSPSHRGFLNTGQIAMPGGHRHCQQGALLDYPKHRVLHEAALEAAGTAFFHNAGTAAQSAFDRFCSAGGADLRDFALFEALSERHGPDWRHWPAALQRPAGAATGPEPDRLRFHLWLQWMADQQLRAAQTAALDAGMPVGLYLDLAVGARRGGAEAWAAQDALAQGVSVGAPPDHLSPAGQNWQLTGYAPRRLQMQQYAPFRQVLAATMRHCGLMRIDHVLGLNRSYWIPDEGSPGGYIRQPFRALMAIVAIEAERAGTVIVGEDLGLVPPGFREEMSDRGLYGYTVQQFEKTRVGNFRRPSRLRPHTLACFGTHDTPTLQGYLQGEDIAWWEKLGWIDADTRTRAGRQRRADVATLPGGQARGQTADGRRDSIHRALAGGATALVAVQLDDMLNVSQAQNLPGTVSEHPNWQRRYPIGVDKLSDHAGLKKTAQIMARAGRSADRRKDN